MREFLAKLALGVIEMLEPMASTFYNEGYDAYFLYAQLDDNPYEPWSFAYAEWELGFRSAETEWLNAGDVLSYDDYA